MADTVGSAVAQLQHYTPTDPFSQVLELEQIATAILQNQPLVLPGPLQTEAYAAAVLSAVTGNSPDHPELLERLEVRMARRRALVDRLDGVSPPTFVVVTDEVVLRRPIGGPAVMREQLDDLREFITRYSGRVQFAVLPLARGAHRGLGGAFEIFERDAAVPIVYLESGELDSITTDPAEARRYQGCMQSLMSQASVDEDVLAIIDRIRADL